MSDTPVPTLDSLVVLIRPDLPDTVADLSDAPIVRRQLGAEPHVPDCTGTRDSSSRRGLPPYRLTRATADTVVLVPADHQASVRHLIFVRATGGDLRDALENDADLTISADPELLAWARTSEYLESRPLPWSQLYRLDIPGMVQGDVPQPVIDDLRESLVEDVLDVEAIPAPDDTASCDPGPAVGRSKGLVYLGEDRVAAQVASRIVALARQAGGDSSWLRRFWPADVTPRVEPKDHSSFWWAFYSDDYVTLINLPLYLDHVGCSSGIRLFLTRDHVVSSTPVDAVVDGDGLLRFIHPEPVP